MHIPLWEREAEHRHYMHSYSRFQWCFVNRSIKGASDYGICVPQNSYLIEFELNELKY